MIRYSVESDIKGIFALWQEAFGDSKAEIQFFLNKYYKPENTLIYETDDKVASMLFLIDGEMVIDKRVYPSYYLYAACTLNEYRGRGYMASLLKFAASTAYKRHKYYICLKPAEDSLYEYYEKYGYKPVFKQKIINIFTGELDRSFSQNFCDVEDLEEIRNSAYKNLNIFRWNNDSIKFAFDHNNLYGGKSLVGCNGYLLYSASANKISVKECTFTDGFHNALAYISTKNNSADIIEIILPADFNSTFNNYQTINSGMMLAVNETAKNIMSGIDNAYLGLTLD